MVIVAMLCGTCQEPLSQAEARFCSYQCGVRMTTTTRLSCLQEPTPFFYLWYRAVQFRSLESCNTGLLQASRIPLRGSCRG